MKLSEIYTIEELVKELTITVSCGGNLLMNVGPNKDGVIVPIFEERLRQLGDWLAVNGEAIYSSSPWSHQNDSSNSAVWYTSKVSPEEGRLVYGVLLQWPQGGRLEVSSPEASSSTTVTLLGWSAGPLHYEVTAGKMSIELPPLTDSGLRWAPAWVLKFAHLSNGGNSVLQTIR